MEIYSSESSPLASGSPALSNNQLITGILLAVVHKAGSAGERVGGAAGELQALPCVVVPHKCIHPQQAANAGPHRTRDRTDRSDAGPGCRAMPNCDLIYESVLWVRLTMRWGLLGRIKEQSVHLTEWEEASHCQFLKLDLNCHILEKALEVGMSITHGESYTLSEWQLLGWRVIPLYSTSLPHVFWSQLPER